MKNKLTNFQIEILKSHFIEIFKIPNIKYQFHNNEIVFYYAKFIIGSYFLDEIYFTDDNHFHIKDSNKNNINKSIWFKQIQNTKKQYLQNINDRSVKFIFQTQCKNYFNFLIKSPNKYLNKIQRFQKKIFESNKLKCPLCNCESLLPNKYLFNCLICGKIINYKYQFNYCELNNFLLTDIYLLDNFMLSYFISDLNFYLYIVAITLIEELEFNLELDEFCTSMRHYDKKGFDARDDEGNIYSFFWYINNNNFEILKDEKYLNQYWDQQFNEIDKLSQILINKYPQKNISIICIDIPNNNLTINSSYEKAKPKAILKTLNNQWNQKINNYQFKNINKLYFFKDLTINHYVLGLREVAYPFLRYLLGNIDEYLHIYDVREKKLTFGGPKHGFMDMYLNEIDAIVTINRLDLCLYSYDYSIASTYMFQKSFIAHEIIIMLLNFFESIKNKTIKLKTEIYQKIFNKLS